MNPKGNPQNLKPWQPGQSGNPNGRPPKSAAERLKDALVEDLLEDYKVRGKAAIAELSPAQYFKAITALLPKELTVEHSGAVAHEHRAVSETAAWLEEVLGGGSAVTPSESLPN